MPSRGLHGPSKKKTTKPRPSQAAMAAAMTEGERMINLLAAISNTLRRIEEMMHVAVHRAPELKPLPPGELEKIVKNPGPLIGPSTLPGGDQEFISGQWHRRAGDVYANVAEPGTPNAGNVMLGTAHDDDDPSGSV